MNRSGLLAGGFVGLFLVPAVAVAGARVIEVPAASVAVTGAEWRHLERDVTALGRARARWKVEIDHANAAFGNSVGTAGDVDGGCTLVFGRADAEGIDG
jgi:hypothetical protein